MGSGDSGAARWRAATGRPLVDGNRVDYLVDGWATFAAMLAAIQTTLNADSKGVGYIYLLGWWLDDDLQLGGAGAKGTSIQELFAKASDEYQIEIKAMLWDQPADPTSPFSRLRKNSAEVSRINKLKNGSAILDNNTRWSIVGAHHQKLLLVRGSRGLIGFCGGVDINYDRVDESPPNNQAGAPMHDVHCRIMGSATMQMVDVFSQRWLNHPLVKAGGNDDVRITPMRATVDRYAPRPVKNGRQSVGILRTFNYVDRHEFGATTICAAEHSIKDFLLRAIPAARSFIYIEDQYLWSVDIADAIASRMSSSPTLLLIVLISHTNQTKNPLLPDGGASLHRRFAERLVIACGDDGYSRRVRVAYRLGRDSKGNPTSSLGARSYVHAKMWIFDDDLAVVGSANCNRRGYESDSEVCAAITDTTPSKNVGFAKNLRMQLWKGHLNLTNGEDGNKVLSPIESFKLWPTQNNPSSGFLAWYDLSHDSQGVEPSSEDSVDPGNGGLAVCPLSVRVR